MDHGGNSWNKMDDLGVPPILGKLQMMIFAEVATSYQ